MDAMSTSCSRLKTVDSNPEKRTNINTGNNLVLQAVAHFTSQYQIKLTFIVNINIAQKDVNKFLFKLLQ